MGCTRAVCTRQCVPESVLGQLTPRLLKFCIASASPACMSAAVVPVLYRHVARLARLHDRDPALKALLLLVPTKEYDWRERR